MVNLKKLLVCLCVFAAPLSLWADTEVEASEPGMICQLEGDLKGANMGLLISIGVLRGEAILTCSDAYKGANTMNFAKPVFISIFSAGIGLGIAGIKKAAFRAYNINLGSVDSLFNRYSLSYMGSLDAVAVGVDVGASLQASTKSGIGFGFEITSREIAGLGAYLRGSFMRIREL